MYKIIFIVLTMVMWVPCVVMFIVDMVRIWKRERQQEDDDDDPEREELEVVPNIKPIYYTQKAA